MSPYRILASSGKYRIEKGSWMSRREPKQRGWMSNKTLTATLLMKKKKKQQERRSSNNSNNADNEDTSKYKHNSFLNSSHFLLVWILTYEWFRFCYSFTVAPMLLLVLSCLFFSTFSVFYCYDARVNYRRLENMCLCPPFLLPPCNFRFSPSREQNNETYFRIGSFRDDDIHVANNRILRNFQNVSTWIAPMPLPVKLIRID